MRKRLNPFLRFTAILSAGTGFLFAASNAPKPLLVRGIESHVAIYAVTNAPRDVVAWLPADTVFTVKGDLTDGPWVCIMPPDAVSVWIYRELVRNGVVVADGSLIRAGAGMSYSPVTRISSRERVKVRGVYGDWLKIAPPPGVLFWVLRDQVEPLAISPSDEGESPAEPNVFTGMIDALTNETTALIPPSPSVPSRADLSDSALSLVPVIPPAELAGYELMQRTDQGEHIVLKGTLDWAGLSSISAPFSLVERQTDGDSVPICLLLAPELTYGPNVGSVVTVEGTRWFVKGSVLPFMIPHMLRVGE